MSRLFRSISRLALVAVFVSLATVAQAQSAPWTLEDLRSGAIERIVGMSDQQAVDFYNRFRPRAPQPDPVSQVLTSPPDTTSADCTSIPNPYTEPARALACYAKPPSPTPATIFRVGRRYVHAYASHVMQVVAVSQDLLGRELVVGVWVQGDPNTTGRPLVFVNDASSAAPWTAQAP
jgi:hypothetical protein